MNTFEPLNVSSKFAICGLPLRVDTYKTCGFGCRYCFANNREIMKFDQSLQTADTESLTRRLERVLGRGEVKEYNLLDMLIAGGYTWHCGGMSDPFQPIDRRYHATRELIEATKPYGIHILFSTKSDSLNGCWDVLDPSLHTFQFSVTNLGGAEKLEPNVPSITNRRMLFRRLKDKGFRVGIRLQPYIPNISTPEIADAFPEADHFTVEGLKLVPQNEAHKREVLEATGLSLSDFTQMGLLNLDPDYRLRLYKPLIAKFEDMGASWSIADNDLHHLGNNSCCCGDALVDKATTFNSTAMTHRYGAEYTKEQLDRELEESGLGGCTCNQLFTSNRQEGCRSVWDFYERRFTRPSSPFSPKFLHRHEQMTLEEA